MKWNGEINEDALAEARRILGISRPVKVRLSEGRGIKGTYKWEGTFHKIVVSKAHNATEANITAWHELVHAKQQEEHGLHEHFYAHGGPYRQEQQTNGYRYNRFEVEARELAEKYAPTLHIARDMDSELSAIVELL